MGFLPAILRSDSTDVNSAGAAGRGIAGWRSVDERVMSLHVVGVDLQALGEDDVCRLLVQLRGYKGLASIVVVCRALRSVDVLDGGLPAAG